MDEAVTSPEQLSQALALGLQRPPRSLGELNERIRSVSPEGLPGDRWARMLLVAFHHHLVRQRWLHAIVRSRLANLESGRVPGEPGWSFYFHGNGCCFTHDDGTELDVDFVDDGAEHIDPWFYDR